jgi:translation initiation factor 3 subunit H
VFRHDKDFFFCPLEYTATMMMHMKRINQDYMHVGWYQACELGAFVTSEFVLAQHGYQDSIEESIVIIYGKSRYFGIDA